MTRAGRLRAAALRPVDAASCAVFRILFGLLALVASVRFIARGWVESLFLAPDHHFTYLGLGWIRPWPGWGLYVHFAAIAALGACIALGWHYRPAMALFVPAFAYVELLDRAYYLNHYYWVTVAGLVMLFLPLAQAWSLDARAGRAGGAVPAWCVWALRGLVGMVYVFAGISKLNPDWLRDGMPLALWLPEDAGMPVVGPLLALHGTALAVSWATVAFELAVVPALVWRRTRAAAYAVVVVFHLGTWVVLPEIGMFPWIMMAGALVFFSPAWPRALAGRLRLRRFATRPAAVLPAGRRLDRAAPWVVGAAAVVMVLVPFRHLLYPGDVRWTEEGYRLSWRVMLTEKVGYVRFTVVDPATGERWSVAPRDVLSDAQARVMAVQPDMILEAAHMVRDDFARRGHPHAAVYADAMVSMNGRPARRLIDPAADLATVHAGLGPRAWVLR